MATFDFRVLLETVEGKKTSYMSQSFVDTSVDLVLSASQVYNRITGSVSCSYQNSPLFSGSNFNTNFTFKDNNLLSSSLSGSQNTGSIIFTAKTDEYDRLLRYKFIGEKVCNVLGLPNSQWIYTDQVRFPVDDESNVFQGNIDVNTAFVSDTLTFANNANINSDVQFLIDTGSDRYIKFIDERGSGTLGLIMGYDKSEDVYEINSPSDKTFNILNFNKLSGSSTSTGSFGILQVEGANFTSASLAAGGGGSTNAAGSDTQVQFNDGGTNFGGDAGFTYDKNTNSITAIHHITASGNISSSGDVNANRILVNGKRVIDEPGTDIITIGFGVANGTINLGRTSGTPSIFTNGSITASGDISSSGTINANTVQVNGTSVVEAFDVVATQGVISRTLNSTSTNLFLTDLRTTGNPTFNNITASGNISSSGTIKALAFTSAEKNVATFADGAKMIYGSTGVPSHFASDITASGNISASGTVFAKSLEVTHMSSSFVTSSTSILVQNITSSGDSLFGNGTSDSHKFIGNITASGNISASGAKHTFGGTTTFGTGESDGIKVSNVISHAGDTDTKLNFTDDQLVFTIGNDQVMTLKPNAVQLTAPVTASGNISASGEIISNGLQDTSLNVNGGVVHLSGNGILTDTAGFTMISEILSVRSITNVDSLTHVTASGNISASATSTGSFGHGFFDSKVGIGTTSPSEKLEVIGNISASGNLLLAGGITASTDIYLDNYLDTAIRFIDGTGGGSNNFLNYRQWKTSATGGKEITNTTGIIKLESKNVSNGLVLSGSNVGIGTAAPETPLEVHEGDTTQIVSDRDGNGTNIVLRRSGTQRLSLATSNTGGQEAQIFSNGDLIFNFSAGDNVGIGKTSPTKKLEVEGDISASLTGSFGRVEAITTLSAEHLESTDDLLVTDDATIGGDIFLGNSQDHVIQINQQDGDTAGRKLAISASNANIATSGNFKGGNVELQGGAKVGSADDGYVILNGGRGNVGIRTFNPTVPLQVTGDISSSTKIIIGTSTVGSYLDLDNLNISSTGDHVSLQAGLSGVGDGQSYISSLGSFSILLDNGGTSTSEYFSIRTDGGHPGAGTEVFRINEAGDITASGNISSSGTIIGSNLSGTNTGDVSLGGSLDYITISGQTITRNAIDLAADVTGILPSANLDSDTAHLTTDQTFTGNKTFSAPITASGNISASGTITSNGGSMTDNLTFSDDKGVRFGDSGQGILGSAASDEITIDGNDTVNIQADVLVDIKGGLTSGVNIDGNITASGNISASGGGPHIFGGPIRLTNPANTTATQRIEFGESDGSQRIEGKNDFIVIESDNQAVIQADNKVNIDTPVMGVGAFTTGDTAGAVLHISGVNATNESLIVEGSDGTDYLTVGLGGHITASGDISASGTLSVGTFSPDNLSTGNITASGDISASGNIILGTTKKLTFDNNLSGAYIDSPGTNQLDINIANSRKVTVTGGVFLTAGVTNTLGGDTTVSGQLGIGITNPTSRLTISSGSESTSQTASAAPGTLNANNHYLELYEQTSGSSEVDSGPTLIFSSNYYNNDILKTTRAGIRGGTEVVGANAGGFLAFYTNDDAPANNMPERMRINKDGNIGIGMTNPSAKLDVTGDLRVSSHITASGNIAADGDISSSGDIIATDVFLPTGAGKVGYDVNNHIEFEDGKTKFFQGGGSLIQLTSTGGGNSGVVIGNGGVNATDPPITGLTVIGAISASDAINTLSHITASGNISSSGTITAGGLDINGTSDFSNTVTFDGKITVAGNIEANGNIVGDNSTNISGINHITASGNISASGAISASDLHLRQNGIGAERPIIELRNDTFHSQAGTQIRFTSGSYTQIAGERNASITYTPQTGIFSLRNYAISAMSFGVSGSEDMRIDSNGKVGINDTSPSAQLDINGNLQVQSHITASGNISASGVYGEKYYIDNLNIIQKATLFGTADTITFGDVDTPSPSGIVGGPLRIVPNITASGDISASGKITANEAQFGSDSVHINGPAGHITASGHISSSGGTFLGKQRHITFGKFNDTGTTERFADPTGYPFDGPSIDYFKQMVAPYNGRLVKVDVHVSNRFVDMTVKLYTDGTVQGSSDSLSIPQNNTTTFTDFTFGAGSPNANFSAGSLLGLSFTSDSNPSDVHFSCVWEFDVAE